VPADRIQVLDLDVVVTKLDPPVAPDSSSDASALLRVEAELGPAE
jgi:hypothetical protein